MGIDATRKWASEGHLREWPNDIETDADTKAKVDLRWAEYGINND
jgi:4-hydroxy-3-polyprenylbenzoate decarboxylase